MYGQANEAAKEWMGSLVESSASTATGAASRTSPTRSTAARRHDRAGGGGGAARGPARRRSPRRPTCPTPWRAPCGSRTRPSSTRAGTARWRDPRRRQPRLRADARHRRLGGRHRARGHRRAATVTANDVVVATHFPFLDRGGFFARMHPERSYALGALRERRASRRACTSRPTARRTRCGRHPTAKGEM